MCSRYIALHLTITFAFKIYNINATAKEHYSLNSKLTRSRLRRVIVQVRPGNKAKVSKVTMGLK